MDDIEHTLRQTQLKAARQAHETKAAHRAVDDPVALARAARIVRAALAREKITSGDLTPLPSPADGDA